MTIFILFYSVGIVVGTTHRVVRIFTMRSAAASAVWVDGVPNINNNNLPKTVGAKSIKVSLCRVGVLN